MTTFAAARRSPEALFEGFAPDFEFMAPPPLPPIEYEERLRKLWRKAVLAGHDAVLVHPGMIGWLHASIAYLRYLCDWMWEDVLIIPTDSDKPLTLLSFVTQAVLLPPGGEPMLVEGRKVWRQLGREGRLVARCTVGRLMKRLRLRGVIRGKGVKTTVSSTATPCPKDRVNRNVTAKRPNAPWLSDLPMSRPGLALSMWPS